MGAEEPASAPPQPSPRPAPRNSSSVALYYCHRVLRTAGLRIAPVKCPSETRALSLHLGDSLTYPQLRENLKASLCCISLTECVTLCWAFQKLMQASERGAPHQRHWTAPGALHALLQCSAWCQLGCVGHAPADTDIYFDEGVGSSGVNN